jgi:signal transduction histidine kinase
MVMIRDYAFYRRWALRWRALAFLAFAMVAVAVLKSPAAPRPALHFWVVYGAFVIWYAASILIDRDRLYNSLPLSLIYFGIGWVLWAVLLCFHEATYAFGVVLFPLTYFSLPTIRAIVFSLVLTGLMSGVQSRWRFEPGVEGLLGIASIIMGSLFVYSVIHRSEERARLIEQLEAARADTARAEREAGILQERQRLAQEIHDTVAQAYVGIVTHLEAAEAAARHTPSVAAYLEAAKQSARTSLAEARRLAWDLRPDLTEGQPLPELIARLAERWGGTAGIPVHVFVTGTPEQLGAEREAALVQGAREALNNARTHARATRVVVTLSYMDNEVVLDVQDDGQGVDSAALAGRSPEEGGFGLRALTERARSLGGTVSLETSPGAGTTLTIFLPSR